MQTIRTENPRQQALRRELLRLSHDPLLNRYSFCNLTEEQCAALQSCINSLKAKQLPE